MCVFSFRTGPQEVRKEVSSLARELQTVLSECDLQRAQIFRAVGYAHAVNVERRQDDGYDYAAFEQQVVEVRYPGQPSVPLGALFNTCLFIENWLAADVANVAVVHCRTGRGRVPPHLPRHPPLPPCLLAPWCDARAGSQTTVVWI